MSGVKTTAGKPSIAQRLSNIMGGAFSSKKAGKEGGKGGKTANRDSAQTSAPATSSQKAGRRLSTAMETANNKNKSKADSGLTSDSGNNAYLRFHALSSAGYERALYLGKEPYV
jgi:hypothetical protein